MDTLQITSSEKRIAINGDPERVIVFNPSDIVFAEKFYRLIGEFETKLSEYQARSEELESQELDSNGIPVNIEAQVELLKEMCNYIREKIDSLFGEGTSQKAFGDALELDMFPQFFNGLMPFIRSVRTQKIEKYIAPAKRNGHKKRK